MVKDQEKRRDKAIQDEAKYSGKIAKAEEDYKTIKAEKEKFDLAEREAHRDMIEDRLENTSRIAKEFDEMISVKKASLLDISDQSSQEYIDLDAEIQELISSRDNNALDLEQA